MIQFKFNKLFYLILFIVFFCFSFATLVKANSENYSQSLSESNSYSIQPVLINDTNHKNISQSIKNIFDHELMRPNVCKALTSVESISIAFGLTIKDSFEIFESCQKEFNFEIVENYPKIFTRKYFIVIDKNESLPFNSWTNYQNETYLVFKDAEYDIKDLQQLLLHEMSISLDAKTNMMLSSFYFYEKIHSKQIKNKSNETIVLVNIPNPENRTPLENKLQTAFKYASNSEISLAFTTIRALELEKFFYTGKLGFENKQNCTQNFLSIYLFIKNSQLTGFQNNESVQGLLASMVNYKISSTKDESAILNFILDPNFIVFSDKLSPFRFQFWKNLFGFYNKNNEVETSESNNSVKTINFCEYMSTPLISGKSSHNLYSYGPRPRIGGGWSEKSQSGNFFGFSNSTKSQELSGAMYGGNHSKINPNSNSNHLNNNTNSPAPAPAPVIINYPNLIQQLRK